MANRWEITYYKTPAGKFPVKDFIDDLDEIAQAKVNNAFELLMEFSSDIGPSHAKKVTGTPLWELRILGQKSLRFFYIAKIGREFLILHGFAKKTQKTPKKEIKTALARLKENETRY